MDTSQVIPPPPPGFVLDEPEKRDKSIPPPPPGFTLDADQDRVGGEIGDTSPAAPKKESAWSGRSLKQGFKEGAKNLAGIGEGALTAATGFASFPISLAVTAAKAMPGAYPSTFRGPITPASLEQTRQDVAGALTYQPKTEGGKAIGAVAGVPGEILSVPKEPTAQLLRQAGFTEETANALASLGVDAFAMFGIGPAKGAIRRGVKKPVSPKGFNVTYESLDKNTAAESVFNDKGELVGVKVNKDLSPERQQAGVKHELEGHEKYKSGSPEWRQEVGEPTLAQLNQDLAQIKGFILNDKNVKANPDLAKPILNLRRRRELMMEMANREKNATPFAEADLKRGNADMKAIVEKLGVKSNYTALTNLFYADAEMSGRPPMPTGKGRKTLDAAKFREEAVVEEVTRPQIPSPEAPGATISGGGATPLATPEKMGKKPYGAPGIVAPGFEPPGRSLTPAETKVMDQIAPRPSVLDKSKDIVKKVPQVAMYEIFDKFHPLKQLEQKMVSKTGKEIPITDSAFAQATSYAGHEGITWNGIQELKKVIEPLGRNYPDWLEYMLARRNIDRAKSGIENPGGLKFEDAKQAILDMGKALPEAEKAKIRRAEAGFRKWNDEYFLRPMRDNGLINESSYNALKAKGEHWFPFELADLPSDIIEKMSPERMMNGDDFFKVTQDVLFPQVGTKRLIKNPVETTLKRYAIINTVIEKNKVLQKLVKLSHESEWLQSQIQYLDKGDKPPAGYGMFGVVLDGKVKKYTAPLDIIKSLQNLNGQELGFMDKFMNKQKRLFTALTTGYNLPFAITNPIRDMKMAAVTSKHPFNPKVVISAVGDALSASFGMPTELVKQYYKSKAGFGGLMQRNLRLSVKELRKPTARIVVENILYPWKLVRNIAQTGEMTPRLGIFKEALKRGESAEAAGLLSRGSTIDFARSGAFVKTISKWVPFLNARAQAKLNLAEAFTSANPVRGKKSHIAFGVYGKPQVAAAAKSTMWILVPALATYFYNRLYHDAEYDEIPNTSKDRYHNIVLGETKNARTGEREIRVVPVPKGDIDGLIWNPIEHFLDWAWKKQPQKMKEVAIQWLGETSPIEIERGGKASLQQAMGSVMPPFMRAGAEILKNENFYWGNKIVPESLSKVEPKEQYRESTPEFYKKMGGLLNISPLMLQHAFRSGIGATTAAPSPKAQWEAVKGRFVRGVAIESKGKQLNDHYETAQRGYYTARLKAMREFEQGRHDEGVAILKAWNDEAKKTMGDIATLLGITNERMNQTPMYKMFTFQVDDLKRMKKGLKDKDLSFFEKKLGLEVK